MEYVEQRNGGYYVAGTRISLDSVVYAYLKGKTTRSIQDSFPLLTEEQILRTIDYYLANRAAVDQYLKHQRAEFNRMRDEARAKDPEFYAKMDAAKKSLRQQRQVTTEST